MLTSELKENLKKSLEEIKKSEKLSPETMLVLLEGKQVEEISTELRQIIKSLIREKKIKKYLELEKKVYCMETLEEFELIEKGSTLTEIETIEKQIKKHCVETKKIIENREEELIELYDIQEKLIEKIFLNEEKQAIRNDKMLIIRQKGWNEIILKDN